MTRYRDLTMDELRELHDSLEHEFGRYRALGLSLDMTRGKPSPAQLDLSLPMLDTVSAASELHAQDGTDCRNYGVLCGLPEARALMASLLHTTPEHVIVYGSSSLSIMFGTVARAWSVGLGGCEPWGKQEHVKFLCPSPGYDRHFSICEHFGIEMIAVEMDEDGPDMFTVRKHVNNDPAVKGIWCVPQYSNPQGYTYSDDTVKAFAKLKPAADDFRIFWDNAYAVHHLYDEPERQDHVADILQACADAGRPDMVYEFCSTSKVTFAGAGISALAASEANIAEAQQALSVETIGNDKINQLRHVRFLRDAAGVAAHMSKHAALLRPKFEAVERILSEELGETGVCSWSKPRGGYFVSFKGLEGTATRIVDYAKMAGVTLTQAGATWPLHDDPHDADIRIAPSYPELEELEQAMRVFVCCVKLASVEQLLLA